MEIKSVWIKNNGIWTSLDLDSEKLFKTVSSNVPKSNIYEGYYPVAIESFNDLGDSGNTYTDESIIPIIKIISVIPNPVAPVNSKSSKRNISVNAADFKILSDVQNNEESYILIYPEFVYDRSQIDVDRVKELNFKYLNRTITEEEKQEWNTGIDGNAGLKGAFTISDIKRIEYNCELIGELLAVEVPVKSWKYGDIPRESDYRRILVNVQNIRDAYIVYSDTPQVPEQPLNSYQKWNDIERILHDVYTIYINIQNSYYYCGSEIYAGEGIGII